MLVRRGRTARLPWRFRPRSGGSLRGRPGRPSPSPPIHPRLSPSQVRGAFRWVAGCAFRRGGPRGGHRRRGAQRGSPLVVERRGSHPRAASGRGNVDAAV